MNPQSKSLLTLYLAEIRDVVINVPGDNLTNMTDQTMKLAMAIVLGGEGDFKETIDKLVLMGVQYRAHQLTMQMRVPDLSLKVN